MLVIPAGAFIAPLLATRNELIGRVAPPGARTEAYTWPVTAFVGGISLGSALAGLLVEGPGWRTAFVVASAFAALGALLVFLRAEFAVRESTRPGAGERPGRRPAVLVSEHSRGRRSTPGRPGRGRRPR